MNLKDIFDQLTTGELSNLALGGRESEDGEVEIENYPTLISHVNLALTALHTRFPLSEKEVILQQFDNITLYKLDIAYAESNTASTEPFKWIKDTAAKPFLDDVLRIDTVYNEVGDELPLNDLNNSDSVFTPNYDTVQIPFPVGTNAISLIYRADHPRIPLNTADVSKVAIQLPDYLLEALLAYVTSRVYAGMNTESSMAASATYLQKYNMLCQEVELRNVTHNSENSTNERLEINGWV